jgi:hypothetical protein
MWRKRHELEAVPVRSLRMHHAAEFWLSREEKHETQLQVRAAEVVVQLTFGGPGSAVVSFDFDDDAAFDDEIHSLICDDLAVIKDGHVYFSSGAQLALR